MAKEFSMDLIGNIETAKMFEQLPEKVQRRVTRPAVTAASAEVRKAFRRNVPVKSGALKQSAANKTVTSKDKSEIIGIIGSDVKKAKDGKRGARHLHLIENGYIAKDGSFVPGQFPLRRALDQTEAQRKEAFGKKFGEKIEKEAIKLGFK